FYDPNEMVAEVAEMGEFLLARQSLVALVTLCEAALLRLNEALAGLGKCAPEKKFMRLLKWAFSAVQNSPVASAETIARLPQTCGDLDNARRLRHCIVHRNGCYDEEIYCKQVVQDAWVSPQSEKGYLGAVAAREPIFLSTERFEYF